MKDTVDAIQTRVAEILIEELKVEDASAATLDPNLDLVDELGIDSMDLAAVALMVRDEFGVTIDEDGRLLFGTMYGKARILRGER